MSQTFDDSIFKQINSNKYEQFKLNKSIVYYPTIFKFKLQSKILVRMENEGTLNNIGYQNLEKSSTRINTPSKKKSRRHLARSYDRSSKSIILTDRKQRVDDYQQYQNLRLKGRKASFKVLVKPNTLIQNAEESDKQISIAEDLQQLHQLMKQLQKECQIRQLSLKECQDNKKYIAQSTQIKQRIQRGQRRYFSELQQLNDKYCSFRQKNKMLKSQQDSYVYKQQNEIYLMTIQLNKAKDQIKRLQFELLKQKNTQKQQQIQLQFAINNRKQVSQLAKKAEEDLNESKNVLRQIKQALGKQRFLTFVLKTQLSPKIRTGFHVTTKQFDHQQCLHKKLIAWDIKKQPSKNLTKEQIFYWMVLQLYKNWRKILKLVPYSNNIYRVLLGLQKGNIDYVMKLLLKVNVQRQSTKMIKRQIVVGSPKYDFYGQIKEFLLQKIISFQNQYLKVTEINLTNEDSCQVLQVRYSLLQQKKVQIFEFHRIKQFTKEEIQRFITPKQQKTILSVVDIPAFIQQEDAQKYKVLYDYFRVLG